jgi:hypothetical protein
MLRCSSSAYDAPVDGSCCASVAIGVDSKLAGGFASSSSSCFATTGCARASLVGAASVPCGVAVGVVSLVLDRLAVAPARPPPLPDLPARGLGGIVTSVVVLGDCVVDDSSCKSYLVLIDKPGDRQPLACDALTHAGSITHNLPGTLLSH